MLWWIRELGVCTAHLKDCSFGPAEAAGHAVGKLVPALVASALLSARSSWPPRGCQKNLQAFQAAEVLSPATHLALSVSGNLRQGPCKTGMVMQKPGFPNMFLNK